MRLLHLFVIPALLAALLAAQLVPVSQAQTLYVDANLTTGANDGSSWANAYQGPSGLQIALTNVLAKENIYVAQGLYKPTQGTDRSISFELQNEVAIYGGFLGTESNTHQRLPFGIAQSILDGDLLGDDSTSQFVDNSRHVVTTENTDRTAILDGFTIRGGFANTSQGNQRSGGGVLCRGDVHPIIRNCRLEENRAFYGGGISIEMGASPTLHNNIFVGNLGYALGSAMYIVGTS